MLRIALVQMNPTVGALQSNREQILHYARRAAELGAQVVAFPELALTGYPPEDLLLRPSFLADVQRETEQLLAELPAIEVLLGIPLIEPVTLVPTWMPATAPDPPDPPDPSQTLIRSPHPRDPLQSRPINAAVWLAAGKMTAYYAKQHLPNYSVFDEQRYFTAGDTACVREIGGVRLGVTVCEDIWFPGPAAQAVGEGAQLILNLNASPYHRGKPEEREAVVRARVRETGRPVVYLNLVGGQDELVFDGRSFLVNDSGVVEPLLPAWREGLAVLDIAEAEGADAAAGAGTGIGAMLQELLPEALKIQLATVELSQTDGNPLLLAQPADADCIEDAETPAAQVADPEAMDLYRAILVGIRDYVRKNGFSGVIMGLSGGVDSALTAALAVDALGAEAVEAVMMPYRYTASMSVEDARTEASLLGIDYRELAVAPMVEAFREGLRTRFADQQENPGDITEQNLQSRCRGVLLMALSNRTGRLLLTTGNKSEMAVGYATLYGDMAGGFAPLKDLTKHWVYRLAHARNHVSPAIPERVLARPPSAELAPDQEDAHSLPPYPVLDAILEAFVEQEEAIEQIVQRGFDRATVERVAQLVRQSEFKRRQAAPGVRISARAFGRDRRYPITSGYRN
jgi:NAD+ synthase (glutamine-hydrolysing)